MIRAVIFDFDGLILDTETPDYEAWVRVYGEHGATLPRDLWAGSIGRSMDDLPFDPHSYLETQVQRALDRETLQTQRRGYYSEQINRLPILPGVTEYLTDARRLGLKLGVASSSDAEWVMGHLQRLGLAERFDTIKCKDDVTRGKPEPEVYLATLTALDIAPGEALALEDSPNGVLAAKRAGMTCVAIPNGMTQTLNFDHADRRLASLAEMTLEALLDDLQRGTAHE